MRDYGTVHTSFWTSPTTHDLPDDAKLLALYLLTGPHSNALGCFRMPDGYAMEDLNWNMERVSKAFTELSRKGWANRCETTKWVFIIAFLKWNPPENPNQIKSLRKLAAQVPTNSDISLSLSNSLNEACGYSEQPDLFPNDPPSVNPSETVTQTVSKPGTGTGTGTGTETGTDLRTLASSQKGAATRQEGEVLAMDLPTNVKGKNFPITRKQVAEFSELYPAVDVMQQLRAMKGWLDANQARRKTAGGMLRFVNSWLAKEQDSGKIAVGSLADRQTAPKKRSEPKEEIKYDVLPDGLDANRGRSEWASMLKTLGGMINRHSFDTWLKPTRGVGFKNSVLYVAIPTPEFKHLESKYRDEIAGAKSAAVAELKFVLLNQGE